MEVGFLRDGTLGSMGSLGSWETGLGGQFRIKTGPRFTLSALLRHHPFNVRMYEPCNMNHMHKVL